MSDQPASDDLFALLSEDDTTDVLNGTGTEVLVPNTAQVRERPAFKRRNAVSDLSSVIVPETQASSAKPRAKAKQESRAKHWCFTINNPEGWPVVPEKWCLGVEYLVVGREKAPSTGTLHYQGYVCFSDKLRLSQVRDHFAPHKQVHAEKMRGSPQQASEYCMKSETRVMDPYVYGVLPLGGNFADRWQGVRELCKRGDFEAIPDSIYIPHLANIHKVHEMTKPKPTEAMVECFWYWGAPGTGKSRRARYEAGDFYIKDVSKWWDNYKGESSVIIDDFDPSHRGMAQLIKTWCDRYPFPAHCKGSMQVIRPTKIWITSNFSIEQCFDGVDAKAVKRRFKVTEFLAEWLPPTIALNDEEIVGISDEDWIEILSQ